MSDNNNTSPNETKALTDRALTDSLASYQLTMHGSYQQFMPFQSKDYASISALEATLLSGDTAMKVADLLGGVYTTAFLSSSHTWRLVTMMCLFNKDPANILKREYLLAFVIVFQASIWAPAGSRLKRTIKTVMESIGEDQKLVKEALKKMMSVISVKRKEVTSLRYMKVVDGFAIRAGFPASVITTLLRLYGLKMQRFKFDFYNGVKGQVQTFEHEIPTFLLHPSLAQLKGDDKFKLLAYAISASLWKSSITDKGAVTDWKSKVKGSEKDESKGPAGEESYKWFLKTSKTDEYLFYKGVQFGPHSLSAILMDWVMEKISKMADDERVLLFVGSGGHNYVHSKRKVSESRLKLESKMEDLFAQVAKIEAEKDRLEVEIDSLGVGPQYKKMKEMEEEVDKAKTKDLVLRAEVNKLVEELKDDSMKKPRKRELKAELHSKKKESQQFSGDLADMIESLDELSDSYDKLKAVEDKLEANFMEMGEELLKLREEIKNSEVEKKASDAEMIGSLGKLGNNEVEFSDALLSHEVGRVFGALNEIKALLQ